VELTIPNLGGQKTPIVALQVCFRCLVCYFILTALHVMQTRYSEEISVCLSVRPSVRSSVCHTRDPWQNGRKICPDSYTIRKNIYPSFLRRRMVGGGRPLLPGILGQPTPIGASQPICCQFISVHIYQFCWFILIFSKMALIFLTVPIVFNISSYWVSPRQISVTSSPMTNGPQFTRPQSTWLSGLEGNAGILSQAATEAKNSSQV